MSAPTDRDEANAYDVSLSPGRQQAVNLLSLLGVAGAIVVGMLDRPPTLWGLLPIILYAVLCLLGMDIVIATVVALVSGLAIMQPSPGDVGLLLGDSLADQITIIGMIIMLGAGVGEVLRVTGVAGTIVRGVMGAVGETHQTAVAFGGMMACLILVASLGTLAGALAIAAPILIPIAARLGFTRSATASMMFIGGCAGLALAPFAGSNVAIMDAAEVGYLEYLRFGAGPLAVLSVLLGLLVVPWMQRRTALDNDFYEAEELGATDDVNVPHAGRTTAVFGLALAISVTYAIITKAEVTFPLLALPALAIVTGLAGGLSAAQIASHVYRGAAKLISIFLLFWLLAALFIVIDQLAPFDVILDMFGTDLANSSAFGFAIAIALLGWVGVPGATAAQVVLLDKVFGELAASIGLSAGAWVIVLLFASKADTYGPFPNGNMVGAMGLARSQNLRNMLITGWILLVPACLVYVLILFVETR